MNRPMLRMSLLAVALGLVHLLVPSPAPASHWCPFCSENRGPTLVDDVGQSAFVVVGSFVNPKPDAKAIGGGTTDMVIETVFKPHDFLKGKKVITLPKLIQDPNNKYLVYCDVFKNNLEPYKGVALTPGGDLVKYLTKAIELKDAPPGARLRHCFDFLQSGDQEVSIDAYREFAKADYADYKDMAKKLPADTLAGWMLDPKTPPYRFGLYASLLGHCGDPQKHGKLLRELIDDPEKTGGTGLDGIMAAYLMLQPKEGWAYLKGMMADSKQDFNNRYAVLRTLRFYYDLRTDLLTKDQVLEGVALALNHGDMADFAIEDLRKWKRWEMTEKVMDLVGKDTHSFPVIKRAILRYALQSPDKRAATYVAEQRKRDAEYVRDAEELLRLEEPAVTPVPEEKKK